MAVTTCASINVRVSGVPSGLSISVGFPRCSGVERWPYRKLQSLVSLTQSMQARSDKQVGMQAAHAAPTVGRTRNHDL